MANSSSWASEAPWFVYELRERVKERERDRERDSLPCKGGGKDRELERTRLLKPQGSVWGKKNCLILIVLFSFPAIPYSIDLKYLEIRKWCLCKIRKNFFSNSYPFCSDCSKKDRWAIWCVCSHMLLKIAEINNEWWNQWLKTEGYTFPISSVHCAHLVFVK